MVENPGRSDFEPPSDGDPSDDPGWGSPVPAEYGSLRAVGPPEVPTSRRRSPGRRSSDPGERTTAASMLRRLQNASASALGTTAAAAETVAPPAPPVASGGGSSSPPASPAAPAGSEASANGAAAPTSPRSGRSRAAATGTARAAATGAARTGSPAPAGADRISGNSGSSAISSAAAVAAPAAARTGVAVPGAGVRARKAQPGLDRTGSDGLGWTPDGNGPVLRAPVITAPIQEPLPIRRPGRSGWFGFGGGANGSEYDDYPRKLTRRERKANRKAQTVRTRATIRHLDIFTVLRVSLLFYLLVLIMVVFASVMLWYAADAFGTLPSMEKSIKTLFDLKTFTVHPAVVAKYTAAGGAVISVAGVFANVLGALIFNLIADLVGGVRVEIDSFPSD